MWRKIFRVIGVIVGWGAIFAYIYFASLLVDKHRAEQSVEEVVITLSDSTAFSRFTTSEQVRKQLKRKGLTFEKENIDSVDVADIVDYISRNGYVKGVDAYVTYSGTLNVNIRHHEPVVRLLCGEANSYVTREGEVFRTPSGSSYYAMVVTGGYRPFVGTTFEGRAVVLCDSLLKRDDAKLAQLELTASELKSERSECREAIKRLKKRNKKRRWEREETFRHRKVGIDASIAEHQETLTQIASRQERLEVERARIEKHQQRLNERYRDFSNLITFVSRLEDDSFWRAEIVQFVADTLSTGEISLRLVPRSGDFVIEFGTLDDSEAKLDKLHEFYEKGLSRMGWDRFSVIDIRYDKQVICTE